MIEVVVAVPSHTQSTSVTATVAFAGEKSGLDWSVTTIGKSDGTGDGKAPEYLHLAMSIGPVKPAVLMIAEESRVSASMSLNAANSPASLVQSTAPPSPSNPPPIPA